MTGDLIIRTCLPQDEQAFVGLNLAFMRETMASNPYWRALDLPSTEDMGRVFREALEAPESIQIFIAEMDGEVIGYANTWKTYSIWSGGRILIIDDLYMAASHRKSGIGEKIMRFLITYAQERQFKRVQLHAELDNHKAHRLYRKLSFQEEEMLFFMQRLA